MFPLKYLQMVRALNVLKIMEVFVIVLFYFLLVKTSSTMSSTGYPAFARGTIILVPRATRLHAFKEIMDMDFPASPTPSIF